MLVLGGCGFHPLYGKQANPEVVPALADIKIDLIQDRVGQQLRNLLFSRLNPGGEPTQPKYILEVTLHESQESLAIQETEVATRASLNISVTYHLRNLTSGKVLYTSYGHAAASYDLLQSEYANLAAAQDAERRSLQVVADDITRRLSFYFTEDHSKQDGTAATPAANFPPPPPPVAREGAPAYPSPPTAGAPPAYEAPGYHPPDYGQPAYQQQYGYQPQYSAPGYQQPPSQQPAYQQPQQPQPPAPATAGPPPVSSGGAYQPNQEPDYGAGGPSPIPP